MQTEGKKAPSKAAPIIGIVKVDEFDGVPSYVRGRMAREQLNECVVGLNKIVAAKHALLATPRTHLSAAALKKWTAFKDQECDEVKVGDMVRMRPVYSMIRRACRSSRRTM